MTERQLEQDRLRAQGYVVEGAVPTDEVWVIDPSIEGVQRVRVHAEIEGQGDNATTTFYPDLEQ